MTHRLAALALLSRHLLTTAARNARERRTTDLGAINTLEIVVIAVGALLAAGGAVLVISNAIKSRTDQIK